MDLLEFSIFKEEKMKKENLEKDQDSYYYVYGNYRKEIIEINENFKKEIIESIFKVSVLEDKETVYNNLLYLLDGVKIIERDPTKEESGAEEKKEIELIENLTIKEVLDMDFQAIEGNININIKELVSKINENLKENIWDESMVEETIANKFSVEDRTNVKLINSLSDYTQFIYELESSMPNNLVSRGQKDCSFDLVPSLYRIHKKKQDVHAKGYEQSFRQRIAHYLKESRERSTEELRAEGQHYGLPTEYLDFTEAHIISLLFAIEEYTYKDNHSIVFFIDSSAFNKQSINKEEKLINLQLKSEKEYLNDYSSCSYFIKLPNINERIHFQKGCFLRVSQQDYLDNKDFIDNIKDKCGIAIINKDYKEEILKELFSLGITFESIYPDKDNLVKSIRFSYEVMQGGKVK
ncbi:FRG domain-containing protein [Clostridium botulinum]|uniref:FRG domain-containing protein n=1 Tax=Clostridium TaxID=1485 RepID=UPI0013F7A956|nr:MULTISPECIES: FRG domain-containing protein [Clostridium]MCS6132702.1 FRG domain-containing protein [Clostridium botulinum]NFL44369.1 FRG domain-containing protein [Clostridium botulinum]NFL88554.1 FRG domain-containing protein [Clostridium botulinum]